jgi:ADP-dependent NAD(P)H-hydrate dehydratase / NAD(P)H-hydrate epimerase
MDEAGRGIAKVVSQFFPSPGTLVLYLGSGNNSGDALVAGRELQKAGWTLHARLSTPPEELKPLPARHWRALSGCRVLDGPIIAAERGPGPLVLLDGLLGIGAKGEMRPTLAALAAEMNALRWRQGAVTVAMDIPSGLNADTGVPEPDAVVADITATVACCKRGLVADAAATHVGRLALVPLAGLTPEHPEPEAALLTPCLLRPWVSRRPFDFHKGQAGRLGILAGSKGFYGAAILACQGALRAGAGLVTLLVKEDSCDILAMRAPPEVMVRPVRDYRKALDLRFDALAMGPGLGFQHEQEIREVMRQAPIPAVVDADALTTLSHSEDKDRPFQAPRLLTPHPGEMERLVGRLRPRLATAEEYAAAHPGTTLLLKGARTVISTAPLPSWFNTTGHPGMATGGMGDVLTGVLGALLAQGHDTHRAAGIGAWLCGRAAELAAMTQSQESVLPSDVTAKLGAAWRELATEGSVF